MSRPFELRAEQHSDVSVLAVVGELDVGTAPHFRRAVGGLLGGDTRLLAVDLTETDFLDSSGLGALVWALFRMRAAGGDIVAVNDDDGTIRATIAMAGLADLIPLERTLEAGLERLHPAAESTAA
jgi:anti-sigma B factor antagonist